MNTFPSYRRPANRTRRLIQTGFLSVLVFWLFAGSAAARVPTAEEIFLMNRINEARENPLVVAASLGMDAEALPGMLPDLADILSTGLPPLSPRGELFSAAGAHAADMLANRYFSSTSPDGRTAADRIADTGYAAAAVEETIGMIGFGNFIPPADAVETVFEKMFRDELNPARTKPPAILNPAFTEIGVRFQPGLFPFGNRFQNVYIAVCDFGTPAAGGSAEAVMEAALFRLINEARRNPAEAAARAGVDPETAAEATGLEIDLSEEGIPPLSRSGMLNTTAAAHADDMLGRLYYDPVSPEGEYPFDRAVAAGYEAEGVSETLGILFLEDFIDPFDAAGRLFDQILAAELNPEASAPVNIFDASFFEIGLTVKTAVLDLGESTRGVVYLFTADFGLPTEPTPMLVGTVYYDENGDGSYNFGEGLPGVDLTILTTKENVSLPVTHTDLLGNFQYPFAAKTFYLSVIEEGEVITEVFRSKKRKNRFDDISVSREWRISSSKGD